MVPKFHDMENQFWAVGFGLGGTVGKGVSQYDKADLNKSQKSRPKTPTASKAIS